LFLWLILAGRLVFYILQVKELNVIKYEVKVYVFKELLCAFAQKIKGEKAKCKRRHAPAVGGSLPVATVAQFDCLQEGGYGNLVAGIAVDNRRTIEQTTENIVYYTLQTLTSSVHNLSGLLFRFGCRIRAVGSEEKKLQQTTGSFTKIPAKRETSVILTAQKHVGNRRIQSI
jgi:hypothetical protein